MSEMSIADILAEMTEAAENRPPEQDIYAKYRPPKPKNDLGLKTYAEIRSYKCDKCDGSGYYSEQIGDYTVSRECECYRYKVIADNIRRSGIADVIDRMTFGAFRTTQDWQSGIKKQAERYANSVLNGASDWLMLSGQVGSGKTHLAIAALGRLLMHGVKAKYVNWREMARDLKRTQFDEDEYDDAVYRLMRPQVLLIDDFFKGSTVTDADINVAYDVINERYLKGLKTIITSEKTAQEVMKIDEAIGSRIYDRAKNYYADISRDRAKNKRIAAI